MLSVMYGVLATMPTTLGIAGYALVSRQCAVPYIGISSVGE